MIKKFSGKYRWLSNFWLCPVIYDGIVYPTVENAYQSAKFESFNERTPFMNCSPFVAKHRGQNADIGRWWKVVRKIEVMDKLLKQKFKLGTFLSEKLIATGDQEIVEGNDWGDTFWGVCNGKGENHLGILIMQIRDKLRENELKIEQMRHKNCLKGVACVKYTEGITSDGPVILMYGIPVTIEGVLKRLNSIGKKDHISVPIDHFKNMLASNRVLEKHCDCIGNKSELSSTNKKSKRMITKWEEK